MRNARACGQSLRSDDCGDEVPVGCIAAIRLVVTRCDGSEFLDLREVGCWQTNSNQSQFARERRSSGRTDLTPLVESGVPVELEVFPVGEAAFLIKVVMDGRVNSGEFLQRSHSTKPEHRAFPPSEWLVGILDAIVEPATRCLFMISCMPSSAGPRHMRRKPIGDDLIGLTIPAHQFSEEFQCDLLIPALGDDRLQHLSFVIYRAPKVMPLAIDLHEDLVDMPAPG